ncbi:ribosomal protein S18-alanine N-acetyltransferase [Cytobacillus praedii]|uniref:[Ribosomal protein bS18]-alanine N-acetyltransferase n=1 Tax=Cytobacillus praedii TaxID=1742358 RepID=A0A4R1AW31_9BACI|nr:ribosomal protein S18-alanine N-acetyltransferase [Cytobacillus praedii]MED3548831.1 ribosomal protein S18-alanine N-acetyltransferase [Cytobacillus praedii]MED3574124.1 ribosomal protein S18-alanine N-acetyltransferase [Cytobacillus praedii]TCJ02662.1 ribosomal-protein-alanine N-acetyltransferase [Cytobacillus praedii]
MNKSLTFRFMDINDVDDILKIEHESFTLPWSKEAFLNELTTNQYALYIGLEEDGKVIGYCGVWIVVDEAQITNVAILPEFRGRKLGEALMRQAMEVASERGARTMSLEVRVSNSIAQSLYRKLGFQNGGIRKNYYSDNQEDALVMWVNL